MFYDNKLKILYVFLFSELYIYAFDNNRFTLLLEQKNIFHNKIIFIDNKENEDNICANFIFNFNIYSFHSEKFYNKNNIVPLLESNDKFWENCIVSIPNISTLKWDQNIIEDNEVISKKY